MKKSNSEEKMIVNIVHVYVKEAKIKDFIQITHENHLGTRKEPGNLRFDVLQDANNPAKFTLYEAFQSKEDALKHKETPHYQKWRDTVADWMAKPREGISHQVLFPTEIEKW